MLKVMVSQIFISFILNGLFLSAEEKPEEILIKFKSTASQSDIEQFTQQHKLKIVEKYTLIEKLYLCQIPEGKNLEEIISELQKYPEIEYAEENQQVDALETDS